MPRFTLLVLLALSLFAGRASGQLVPRDGRAPIAVKSHRVEALVEDGLARTTVRQTFVNPHATPLEAVYVFPLPEGAALVDVAMEVGGLRLEGLLAERKRARKVYDDIVRSQRDPALVEQIGRNAFRLSVFPVVPDQETVVEISWTQRVPLTDGAFRYVYPLALGQGTTRTEQDFTAVVRVKSSAPLRKVAASREDMHVARVGEHEVVASYEEAGALLAKDLVVTAEVAVPRARLDVRTFRGEESTGGWFQVVVTPPRARPDQLVPRDVILVLDASGSMKGDKIEQAKASAQWLLDNVRPVDRVSVLKFNSGVEAFAKEPVLALPENLAALREFVKDILAGGGTALGDALLAVAAIPETEGRARTVVLLSDGRPTVGETAPVKLVALAGQAADAGLRLFPFGVGTDLDEGLLRGIAAAGRGRAEIFRPGSEIATRLTTFLARTSAPVLADLALEVDGVTVAEVYPRPLPDAYLGEQVTITGRYVGAGPGEVRVSAVQGGARRVLRAAAAFPAEAGGAPSVAQLFAREKLAFLGEARRLRLGLTDDAYFAALDRGAYSTAGEIVEEMIATSLGHGVQCPYTSFLVLLPEDRHRLDPRDTEAVAAAVVRAREEVGLRARTPAEEGESTGDPYRRILGSRDEGEAVPGLLHEPVLKDAEVRHDADFLNDSPFDSDVFNDVIGMGGGAGGKFSGRFGGRRNLRADGGSGTEQALADAKDHWLVRHQDADGKWDADGFTKHCADGGACAGPGRAELDVGVTSLSLLAFLGAGSTTQQGRHKDAVSRGVEWLRTQQDPDTGAIGRTDHAFHLRDHALATLAICEAYYFGKSPLLKQNVQLAVSHLARARVSTGGWHHGASDLTATGWAILALSSARDAGLQVEDAALDHARIWIDSLGDGDDPLALAMGILGGLMLGRKQGEHPEMSAHADRLLATLPPADAAEAAMDQELLHFGSYAMFQMGGQYWKTWNAAMKRLVLGTQHHAGPLKGTWDPVGPGAVAGGRVYSTALQILSLEVYFRYSKLIGAR